MSLSVIKIVSQIYSKQKLLHIYQSRRTASHSDWLVSLKAMDEKHSIFMKALHLVIFARSLNPLKICFYMIDHFNALSTSINVIPKTEIRWSKGYVHFWWYSTNLFFLNDLKYFAIILAKQAIILATNVIILVADRWVIHMAQLLADTDSILEELTSYWIPHGW